MELRHLRYVVTLGEELHFGRAAHRLNIAQPSLSQQVRRLEDEIAAQLFKRTKRRVELTEAGRLFLVEARRTLSQAEHAIRTAQRASQGEVGRLAIGFVPAADLSVLPKVIPAFSARFPAVQLTLQNMTGADQVEALRAGRIHLGILRRPVDDETLAIETILREPFVLVLPQSHRFAAMRRIPLRALSGEPYIFFPRRTAPGLYDLIVSFCRQAGVALNVAQEADYHMQTMLGLVAAGLGVCLIPASVQHLKRDGVIYRPLGSPVPHVEMSVAYRRDLESQALRNFLEIVRDLARRGFR